MAAWMTIVAVLALAALAPAARAQTPLDGDAYAFPVPDYVGSLVGANSLDSGHGATKREPHHKRVRHATRRQLATLRYRPTAAVTQSVYQRVIEQVGPAVDPAVLTAQLDAAKAEFRKTLARVGWSSRDLGDMAAFSLVQAYVTWHERITVPAAGLKALRRTVRDNLARQSKVRRLPDARQQEIAEILELRVIFFLDTRNDAQAAGDSAGVAIARSDMRDWTKAIFGVDVNTARLTSRGLVAR
jgi:hypothetical protein